MTYDEYKAKEKAIKADFSARRADLAKAEAKEVSTAWGEHLSWKLKNCEFAVGDFVEYAARNWVVLDVKIEAIRWSGHDVLANLKRVKKDLSPMVRDELEWVAPDRLKKIDLNAGG
jgi:hypothetical protein